MTRYTEGNELEWFHYFWKTKSGKDEKGVSGFNMWYFCKQGPWGNKLLRRFLSCSDIF